MTTFPTAAVGVAIAGIACAFALSFALGHATRLLVGRSHSVAGQLAAQVGLWVGLGGTFVGCSRRYGSSRVVADYALRFRRADAPLGLALSVAEHLAALGMVTWVVLISKRFDGSNVDFKIYGHNLLGLLLILATAVVGAPIIEEIFFRGLLLQSLRSRLSPAAAIVVQGVIFGACHLQPALGWANVGVIVSTGTFGVIQGQSASELRRLGANVWAHALFNLLPVAAFAFHG